MSSGIHWLGGDPTVRAAVEDWFADPERARVHAQVLRDNPRRRLVRIESETTGVLLVKHHRLWSGRHPWRERFKAWLRRSPSDREFRVLVRLRAAGVPVPAPLARGVLPGGDRLLVMRFEAGPVLSEALQNSASARRRLLIGLGHAVAGLHERGVIHGDLHVGNVLCGPRGLLLLDLQHARSGRTRRLRGWDIARMEYSLWANGVSLHDRLRFRAAALGLKRPFDAKARRALRAVGEATQARAREHAASRTKRARRSGRRFGEISLPEGRGLRLREIDEEQVAAALVAHRQALARADERLLKSDGRTQVTAVEAGPHRLVVKEVLTRGLRRRFADWLRGSAARRSWLGGHGLQARFIGAATPMAYLEKRRLGVPVASMVVLEDLRPAHASDRAHPEALRNADAVRALGRLAITLHRRRVDHGDLKANNIYLDDALAPRLLDLEDVRFPRRLSERKRRRALSQLNASLPDAFPDDARCAAFQDYMRALPFRRGAQRALRRIVATSLAREHRWSGAKCDLATRARNGSG